MRNTVGVLLTTFLLAGCPSDETILITPGPIQSSQYEGNYLLSCEQDPDGSPIWLTVELSIQPDTFAFMVTGYTDSECSQVAATIDSTFSVDYPGGTVITSLGEADFINLTQLTNAVNGEAAAFDNMINFDLILLDGNNLYSGLNTDSLDGETPETRPDDVDVNIIYVRL